MFKRGMLYVVGLIASFVVPYLVFGEHSLLQTASSLASWFVSNPGSSYQAADWSALGESAPFSANQAPGQRGVGSVAPKLVGSPVTDLAEVLRFDVSPDWVLARWSRVSTVLADGELEGFRVPLVTGTELDDLAGSLTYYFDKQRTVQRLTFHGYTGDERRLAALAARQYQLKPVQSLNAGLYLAKWNGEPKSALRVTLAPVVRADSPNTRLEVMLEINRPSAYYRLSPEMQDLLERDFHSGRL